MEPTNAVNGLTTLVRNIPQEIRDKILQELMLALESWDTVRALAQSSVATYKLFLELRPELFIRHVNELLPAPERRGNWSGWDKRQEKCFWHALIPANELWTTQNVDDCNAAIAPVGKAPTVAFVRSVLFFYERSSERIKSCASPASEKKISIAICSWKHTMNQRCKAGKLGCFDGIWMNLLSPEEKLWDKEGITKSYKRYFKEEPPWIATPERIGNAVARMQKRRNLRVKILEAGNSALFLVRPNGSLNSPPPESLYAYLDKQVMQLGDGLLDYVTDRVDEILDLREAKEMEEMEDVIEEDKTQEDDVEEEHGKMLDLVAYKVQQRI